MISLNRYIFNPKIPTSKNVTQIVVILYARMTIAYIYIYINDDHGFLLTMM